VAKKKTNAAAEGSALWMTETEPFAFLAIKKTQDPLRQPFATGGEAYVKAVVDDGALGKPQRPKPIS